MKLGNLAYYSIKELYEYQFSDLYKFWLYIDGPKYIYEMLMKCQNKSIEIGLHDCDYCKKIIEEEINIDLLKKMTKKRIT